MLYLVTGGAGFIGSHITDRLLADGHEVRILDNFSTGHRSNIPDSDRVSVTEGDVADPATVRRVMQGVDRVFHEAAIASVPQTIDDPPGSERVNYGGTLNILEAARAAGVRRVVFASSAAVYGDLPELPKREDMPIRPLSPYAVDKLASEQACLVYARLYGLEAVALRYFNVFGPRQDPSSPYSGVISIFHDRLRQERRVRIYGDGEQTRDFVYIEDVVEANIRAMETAAATGHTFNIATGNTVTINELLRILCRITDLQFGPEYLPARAGDIRESCADIGLARNMLGWSPRTGLETGLRKLLAS